MTEAKQRDQIDFEGSCVDNSSFSSVVCMRVLHRASSAVCMAGACTYMHTHSGRKITVHADLTPVSF